MSSKHTQGNWTVGDCEIFRPASTGSISPYWQQICSFVNTGTAECKANAKLIAASPELLNACIEALKHHQGGHSEIGHILREAIKKATE